METTPLPWPRIFGHGAEQLEHEVRTVHRIDEQQLTAGRAGLLDRLARERRGQQHVVHAHRAAPPFALFFGRGEQRQRAGVGDQQAAFGVGQQNRIGDGVDDVVEQRALAPCLRSPSESACCRRNLIELLAEDVGEPVQLRAERRGAADEQQLPNASSAKPVTPSGSTWNAASSKGVVGRPLAVGGGVRRWGRTAPLRLVRRSPGGCPRRRATPRSATPPTRAARRCRSRTATSPRPAAPGRSTAGCRAPRRATAAPGSRCRPAGCARRSLRAAAAAPRSADLVAGTFLDLDADARDARKQSGPRAFRRARGRADGQQCGGRGRQLIWARRAEFSAMSSSYPLPSIACFDTGAIWPTASEYFRYVSIDAPRCAPRP